MEASGGTGIGRLDCYEDMFKEITRKLYGDDPDHRSDCMSGGAREVAEHFIDLHGPRLDDNGSRNKMHRKDYLGPNDLNLEDIVAYLEKVRERGDRLVTLPTRRTQETQTVPAVLLPVTSSFLLQELPAATPQQLLQPQPQHQQHQQQQASPVTSAPTTRSTPAVTSAGGGGHNSSGKRYTCLYCPYGTDRRDLYTRHENIHREEKPFHCYVCYKPFSRADHVKKHFLRMHREHTYELSRIRRPLGSSSSSSSSSSSASLTSTTSSTSWTLKSPQQSTSLIQPTLATSYQHGHSTSMLNAAQAVSLSPALSTAETSATNPTNSETRAAQHPPRLHSVASKAQPKSTSGSTSTTKNLERRYTCCYCSWSGVDNWCLKRHLNTHLKPFACTLCEYKAARAERLATHVLKVHNRRQCSRCSFLADDLAQLQVHQLHVHRVSNPGSSAAAAAAAAAATVTSAVTIPHEQTGTTRPRQQSQSNNEGHEPSNGGGGGRAPPGPPVFPASSAAIAPATTVVSPSTILGPSSHSDRASVPLGGCWEQETSSCEARFERRNDNGEHRRSRKQSTPRKAMTCLEMPIETPDEVSCPKAASKTKMLRCYQCPKRSAARTKAYHSKPSLLLHKIWRHKANSWQKQRKL